MTLTELIDRLRVAPADALLAFSTEAGEMGAGYHVTEFRASRTNVIDCGGGIAEEDEVRMQILDGAVGGGLTVGRFLRIAERSLAAIGGLDGPELVVETAPGNGALQLHTIGAPQVGANRVVVPLSPLRASCRPAAARNTAACCAVPAARACCG
jgi:hypothetical protein